MNSIALMIIIVYMVIVMSLSIWSKKFVATNTTVGYLLAGKSMPWWLTAVMITGMAVGGASTVGVAQNAFTAGISAGWYTGAWAMGSIVFGVLVSQKIEKMNISTVTQIFQKAFGTSNAIVAIIAQVVILFGINAAQIIAGGSILSALMPDLFSFQNAMILSALVFVFTSFFGGYLGASIANFLNVIVIYLGLIVAVVAGVVKYGGTKTITAALPAGEQWYNLISGMGPAIIIGWYIVMVINVPSNQLLYQVSAASRNQKSAKYGMLMAALLIFPAGFLSAYLGIIGASQFAGVESARVLPLVVTSLGPVIAGITLAGLWAADVSTAVSLMLGVSIIITKDVVVKYFKPDMKERSQVLLSKLLIFVTASLGLVLAMRISSIIGFIMQLATLYTPLTVIILAVIYTPKLVKKSSCSLTLLSGVLIMILWMIMPNIHIVSSVVYLAIPVCIAVFLLTSIFDSRLVDLSVLYNQEVE